MSNRKALVDACLAITHEGISPERMDDVEACIALVRQDQMTGMNQPNLGPYPSEAPSPYAKDGVDGHWCVRVEAYMAMKRERDLALAHDTQPYPTADAYEKVCAARIKWQKRAEAAEQALVEAERRGAERGWDEGAHAAIGTATNAVVHRNPYRSAS